MHRIDVLPDHRHLVHRFDRHLLAGAMPRRAAVLEREGATMSRDFNWSADETVVLREQPATAVYVNEFGQAVIRQERPWDQDEDVFVVINRAHIQEIIDALAGLQTGGAT